MKSTDLLLGDWVHVEDHGDFQVEALDIEGGVTVDNEYYATDEDCTAIPLTAEILEKNGFSNSITVFSWYDFQGNRVYVYPAMGSFTARIEIWHDEICRLKMEYIDHIDVEELQHALWICHIKKKIAL